MYHTYITLIVPIVLAFASTLIAIKFMMPLMLGSGITATDYNKKSKPTLPSGLGTALSFGFSIGILAYIFGASFNIYTTLIPSSTLFAAIVSLLLISLVGFLDDIHVRKVATKTTGMMDTRVGLKQWQKPVLTLIGAVPLIAINAGVSVVNIPIIGHVALWLFYPLVVIPLAVIFAANAFNLLGGFNGISTASGIIVALAMLLYSIIYGNTTGALLSGVLLATLLAFVFFDGYPSKIIPGDSYTYAVGAGFVITMILGNMESFGVIIFLPWIIEFILHVKGRFDITDLGKLQKDGTMAPPYGKKIYSWTHVIMNIKPMKEWEVTAYMTVITFGFVILGFALKASGLL
jgi:UDP-N-acetylglucosamine--dolichyl-phosphate N-acetylglucosaminephosphotransferase